MGIPLAFFCMNARIKIGMTQQLQCLRDWRIRKIWFCVWSVVNRKMAEFQCSKAIIIVSVIFCCCPCCLCNFSDWTFWLFYFRQFRFNKLQQRKTVIGLYRLTCRVVSIPQHGKKTIKEKKLITTTRKCKYGICTLTQLSTVTNKLVQDRVSVQRKFW